jgi:hypothetical protein
MKFEVTRDVINDLWPLYQSGEASPDTRALVEAFLSENGTFASTIKESAGLHRAMPPVQLSPDAERRLLDDARERARIKMFLIAAVIALAGFMLLAALGAVVFAFFRNVG